jgi:tetratricopeptide (TPR) repeat protein
VLFRSDLAEIAVEIAAQVGGELAGRRRLQSYAWAFFSNALRVSGDLASAEGALAKSRSFRELSSSTNPALLGEERFLEIEASLRRAQRRFPEALICMRRALAEAEVGARQELLLNLGNLLIEMGQQEEATSPLEEAIRLVDPQREPRLAWAARFNLLVCLCALDRAAEGETWLPELREIASALGNGLDQVRLRWLESQVHAALGRPLEAIEALEEARDAFALRGMQYDVALAGLELCVLLLQEGRAGEVKEQAPGLAVTFQQLGIERERLATLTLFCAAAQVEQATVDQARAALAISGRWRATGRRQTAKTGRASFLRGRP